MKTIGYSFLVLLGTLSIVVGETVCPVYPIPKEWHDLGTYWQIGPEDTAIVISESSSEVQRYAAERLQQHLKNRFGQTFAVVSESQIPSEVRVCLRLGVNLPGKKPEQANGFSIGFTEEGSRKTATVNGTDVNGMIYGADVLFDLMWKDPDNGDTCLSLVEISDWPSIPWRGRPHFILMQNLVPGALDAYVWARMNYTDVRDNPNYKVNIYYPDRAAPMGFPPGVPLDRENVEKMIRESQRRGLFVYGCVAAASNKKAGGIIEGFDKLDDSKLYGDVNQTFEELLTLGVDGLWLSFDDIGQGADPKRAIGDFLALAKKHGLSGRQLAYTPPWGDYNVIDTPFNHEASKIAGFNEVQWFFTRVPCAEDSAMCQKLGLKLPPAWWHNLIGLRGGFTNNANIAVTLRDGHVQKPAAWADYPAEIPLPAYLELQTMAAGWGSPNYDKIRDAAKFTDNVMLWCVGGGWPEEYLVGMIGLWAWAPETHDWARMRTKIYDYVYGPEMVETARKVDDGLVALKSYFDLPIRTFGPNKGWPCRLKNVSQRAEVLQKLDELDALAKTLCDRAGEGSALTPERLEIIYLEPLRATLGYARTMATLEYPEYVMKDLDVRVATLCMEGKMAEAEKQTQDAIRKVESILPEIASQLAGLKGITEYIAYWKKRIATLSNLKERKREDQSQSQKNLEKILNARATDNFPIPKENVPQKISELFVNREKTPSGGSTLLNITGWKPENAFHSGPFEVGLYSQDGVTYSTIGFPRHVAAATGAFGCFCVKFTIPEAFREESNTKLYLDFYTTDTRMDGQYAGYQFASMSWNGTTVWKRDVVANQFGAEWQRVEVTSVARQQLTLGNRDVLLIWKVENEAPVGSYPSISFLGETRLTVE
ncbi:MAG: glycoside hydrolase family 20 zincin-like fold domain-containing protein [Planctomycetia bacterium]|nr:glycoside hydrolase family 20 zincin-like fold domain-containing protein [Planctomycetia bacterium]